MDIYVLANWFTGFIEAFCMFNICDTFLKRRENINQYIYILSVICIGILINISNALFSITLVNISLIVFLCFLFACMFDGKIKFKILLPMFNYMLIMAAEMVVLLIMSVVLGESIDNIISEGNLRVIGIFLSKIFGYAVIKMISFKFSKKMFCVDINYWILFFIMFAVTTFILFTFCKILEESYTIYIRNLITASMVGLSVACIIVMILYENTLKQKYVINQNQISEVKLKEQLNHYNHIMMTQGQVKKLKHDLENHLLSIKMIIKKQQYNESLKYIDNLLKNINVSNSYVDTGNTVLDAIISAKKTEAEKKGIAFNLKVQLPSNLPISQEDVCIIFGNALDNAIEAAEKTTNKKYIDLSLVFDKGALVCKIQNSMEGVFNDITSKSDTENHGIGKYNMQEVLNKYDAVSRVICNENEYILTIVIMGLDKNI